MGCYQSENYKIWKQFTTFKGVGCYGTALLSIAKLQNLKAIHNSKVATHLADRVVINRKTTKFESNSQRGVMWCISLMGCYQSQNYKIWKQFTTGKLYSYCTQELLSIAKLQNLKAIHNVECYSGFAKWVVINCKTTKFESNSQLLEEVEAKERCCYQSQNYKIWKQFTTAWLLTAICVPLLSIAKLQNLKSNSQQ